MQGMDADRQHWSQVAREWVTWARAPNHDAFWAYRASLVSFIGPGAGVALDVGCGEGRVARELLALGYRVIATDPVAELVERAAEARSAHGYAVAGAAALPFEDDCFDLVMAYNVLMDVADVLAALREMRRILRPSGQLVISIVQPFADRGCFADASGNAPFVVRGTYFGRQRFEGVEERNGLRMHFAGWSQPLEAYATAVSAAGLVITSLREPAPDLAHGREHLRQWTRVPLFLWLKVRIPALNSHSAACREAPHQGKR
ncbi:MAG: class I SAM-dependent methyltransferase [Chloroflexi bacterium]|nr:class I SAM-dependent methyltransferase [Chloroflexota bacterium]